MIDEQAIIQSVLSGNRDAYADLVRVYHVRIRGFCRSMLGNATDADDVAQEVFVKAYKSLHRFRGEASFGSWLYRIAANHCKDWLRKKARAKTHSLDAMIDAGGESAEWAGRSTPSMADAELIDQALTQIKAEHRQILLLREVEGLRYDELQEALSISQDAVKGRLKRARQAFSKVWRHVSATKDV